MSNLRYRTTVHLPVNIFAADRHACRPRRDLVPAMVEPMRTDSPVTCGNCLKVIAKAERLAHTWLDAINAGMAEAEEHHAHDVQAFERGQRDRFAFYRSATITRERHLAVRTRNIAYWFRRGEVDAMENAAWSARRMELEHAYLAELVERAELEAWEHQRRLELVANGRAAAAVGARPPCAPYPVDDPTWLRCSLSLTAVTERLAEKRKKVAWLMALPGELDANDLYGLGRYAFDVQRDLDIIHARVIGECPGCFRTHNMPKWGHRAVCPMYLMDGGLDWTAEDAGKYWVGHTHSWTDIELREYWATVDPNR